MRVGAASEALWFFLGLECTLLDARLVTPENKSLFWGGPGSRVTP